MCSARSAGETHGKPRRPWRHYRLLQIEDQRHQGLGNKASAIEAEMTALVRACAEGIGLLLNGHALSYWHSSAKRSAHRADEGADFLRVLHAGRAFDPGGNVDAGRARDAQRFRDIIGIEGRPTA